MLEDPEGRRNATRVRSAPLAPGGLWEAIEPLLLKELGNGCRTACWRRLSGWQAAGVCERLPERLPGWLSDGAAVDGSRASPASVSVRAKGEDLSSRRPTDRGKPGSTVHPVVDATASHRDPRLRRQRPRATRLLPLVDATPPSVRPRTRRGRPRP